MSCCEFELPDADKMKKDNFLKFLILSALIFYFPDLCRASEVIHKKAMVKEYAIQFYSGAREPETHLIPCVDIPIFVLKKDQTFYMLSQTFPTYDHAKRLLASMQKHCDSKIDAWIRPVYLKEPL